MSDKPYDQYVNKIVDTLKPTLIVNCVLHGKVAAQEKNFTLNERTLRWMLTSSWLDGLGHSVDLIRGETE